DVELVKFADVDGDFAVVIGGGEHVAELRTAHDLFAGIRGAGVHGLREGLVETVEEDEELRFSAAQFFLAHGAQRTEIVDGMDDGPGQREEGDAVALELERNELAVGG